MTHSGAAGMPLHSLVQRTSYALDELAVDWLTARGERAPTPEEIQRDRANEVILAPEARKRLRRFHVARFALATGAQFEHHAQTAVESAVHYDASYQELGAASGTSRQYVHRRYGATNAERAAAHEAITAAAATLAPFPTLPDATWSNTVAHNYLPESELSAALVTLDHATISTPVHVLLFHHGQYLGTATDHAMPSIHLLTSASTNAVVVLEFHELGDPHAGPPKAIRTAQFRWLDNRVEWFGTLPPDTTSTTARCGYTRFFATSAHIGDLFECDPSYVNEGHLNGSTVLRVVRDDGAIEYLSGTRYDDDPLTWQTDEVGTTTVDLDGKVIRTYPAGTTIRIATREDLWKEADLRI